MARSTKQMKVLEELIAEKRAEISTLQTEVAVLEQALRRATGAPAPAKTRVGRGNVKAIVNELLEAVGDKGLNAVLAVEMANGRGERLERGSVSSLLSRLKGEGAVEYDGAVYRLKKFSKQPAGPQSGHNVLAHPASRAAP